MSEPTEPKNKKGVEITFGGSERKPGERINENLLDVNKFSNRILKKVKAQFQEMDDTDKHTLEEKIGNIRSELMTISDGLGDDAE